MAKINKWKELYKRILLSTAVLIVIVFAFTLIVNIKVAKATEDRIYENVDSIPHNKVGLLLGTNPLNRIGRPNTYFTNRIRIAAELYHAGKIDYILASGDNHTRMYDEPTAMRDSLIAHGIPENRIILDYAGFRTLDSVVRAKEVFGCDSITIISQADHCARALYLAEANGMDAFAIAAPLRAGRWVRIRLAIREWLARDKMMLDLWMGKRPHFLGEKVEIPNMPLQKSYSTNDKLKMVVVNPDALKMPVDSIVVEMINNADEEATFGEWYNLEKYENDKWVDLQYNERIRKILEDGGLEMVFNAIGYPIRPHSIRQHSNPTKAYNETLVPGRYRLSKTFHYPPYPTLKSDTAYVEFEIR